MRRRAAGERLAKVGDDALAAGRRTSARQAYWQAANYMIASTCFVDEMGQSAQFGPTWLRQLRSTSGNLLLAWHWHPYGLSSIIWPHLHFSPAETPHLLRKTHVPTGFVTIVAILRCCIAELGVAPRRADWAAVLAELQAAEAQPTH